MKSKDFLVYIYKLKRNNKEMAIYFYKENFLDLEKYHLLNMLEGDIKAVSDRPLNIGDILDFCSSHKIYICSEDKKLTGMITKELRDGKGYRFFDKLIVSFLENNFDDVMENCAKTLAEYSMRHPKFI